MKQGLNQIVLNVVVGVWLAMGFLIVQPVSAEEKAAVTAPPVSTLQSVSVSAPMVKGALPGDDPSAAVWSSATLARFPMTPQVHWPTRILDATVKHLNVRALHDGTSFAILLEYADPTEDPDEATQITTGGFINIAFAVWDGKKDARVELKEKGSQKAVTSWWNFRAEAPPNYSGYYYAAIAVGLALGFQFVLIHKLKKGHSADRKSVV